MEQILIDASNEDVGHGPALDMAWGDVDDVNCINRLAEVLQDPRHVATMPMYQAIMTLQFEYARCQLKLRDLVPTLKRVKSHDHCLNNGHCNAIFA
jgi:hypothetical protein